MPEKLAHVEVKLSEVPEVMDLIQRASDRIDRLEQAVRSLVAAGSPCEPAPAPDCGHTMMQHFTGHAPDELVDLVVAVLASTDEGTEPT